MERLPDHLKLDTSLPRKIDQRIAVNKSKENYFDEDSSALTQSQMRIMLKYVLNEFTPDDSILEEESITEGMTAWEMLYTQSESEDEDDDVDESKLKEGNSERPEVEMVLNDETLSKLSSKELQRALEYLISIPNPLSKQLLKIKNKVRDRNSRRKNKEDDANNTFKKSKRPNHKRKQNNSPGKNVKLNFIAKS